MKVLTFTSLFPNTIRSHLGVFVYQRVAHVARLPETDVHVVAPVPYCPSWLKFRRWGVYSRVAREEQIGDLWVSHPRYPLLPGILMPLHGFLMFLGCVQQIRRMHRRIGFDCIDTHYVYPDGFAAVLLGKTLGLPTFVSARG